MPSVVNGMRTFEDIHEEIERLSEERTELWHRLSGGHDPDVRAEIRTLDTRLDGLWTKSSARSVPDCASAIARRSSPAPASKSGSSAQPDPLSLPRRIGPVAHRVDPFSGPPSPSSDGASRARTGDLLDANQALSQLSYGPAARIVGATRLRVAAAQATLRR